MSYAAVVGLPSLLNLRNASSCSSDNNVSQNQGSGGDGGGEDPYPNQYGKLVTVPSYKWRMVIAYDGTRFSGWQYQQSPPTIQCIVEKALTRITKQERSDLQLVGASRTDTGVHAWGQVAHFVTPFNYDCLDSIHAALNSLLPSDIRLQSILLGSMTFSSFVNVSRNDRSRDPVKNIFRFDILEMGPLLQLEVEGSGFLYRQVRNMVALLLQIGREAIPPDIVPNILATRDRKELAKFALSAPPHGLCLVSVNYSEEHLRLPTGCPATSFGRHHSISKCKLLFF
ncbi:pseudouridine synthase family protein [Actinidia rufa]|uniref:tRNA pseudouridine synthase n=1 Tax=Actinidia rufa TaxID=165716 RepID=A0A7J0HG62_9ERIC|nr:pseudouridine synthase family protein [Actinidia rufa]